MSLRILDLFCGAGGAAMGYHRAGFDVVGVDIEPQPHYPFPFFRMDAMKVFPEGLWKGFDAVHASPPCNDHSSLGHKKHGTGWLLEATLEQVTATGLPWVVENVVGPDVKMAGWWFVLCGSMFDMKVRRHRRFGSSELFIPPPCRHAEQGRPWTVTGHGGGGEYRHSRKPATRDFWRFMDMPWMEGAPSYGVAQAIPPAYTEWIGTQLIEQLKAAA